LDRNEIVIKKTDAELLLILEESWKYENEYVFTIFLELEKRRVANQLTVDNALIHKKYMEFVSKLPVQSIRKFLELSFRDNNPWLYGATEDILREKEIDDDIRKEKVNYSGIWDRFLARVIDSLILFAVFFFLRLLFSHSYSVMNLFIQLGTSLITIGYFMYFHKTEGATPGKKIMSLRVVTTNFESLTWENVLLRQFLDFICFFYYLGMSIYFMQFKSQNPDLQELSSSFLIKNMAISVLLSLLIFADLLTAFFSKKVRTVHDMIGGTVVIYH